MTSPIGGLPQLPFEQRGQLRLTGPWAAWFSTAQNILQATSGSGITANRPTTNQYVGMFYFDTTLGIPVWLKTPGSVPVWVNGAGAPV